MIRKDGKMSMRRQCEFLELVRSTIYYQRGRANMRSVVAGLPNSIPAPFEKAAGQKKKPVIKKASRPAGGKQGWKREEASLKRKP